MGDFSTVSVDVGCGVFPRAIWGSNFQTKHLPDHEIETACISGTIRSDGVFVRHDNRWNPSMNGWIEMRSGWGQDQFFCVRFANGKVVEVTEREMPFTFNEPMAWESENDWHPI